MVFTSVINFVRCRGPDEFWRKRKIFKLAAVSTTSNSYTLLFTFFNFAHTSIFMDVAEIVTALLFVESIELFSMPHLADS